MKKFRVALSSFLTELVLCSVLFFPVVDMPVVGAAVPQLTLTTTANYWNFTSSTNSYLIDWSTAAQGWYAGTIANMYDRDSANPTVDFTSPRAAMAQKNPACWANIGGSWKTSASAAGGAASYARNTTALSLSSGGMPVVATVSVNNEWNLAVGFEYKWNMTIWNDGVVFVQDKWYRDGDGLGRGVAFRWEAAVYTASKEGPTGDYYVYSASSHATTPVNDVIVVAKSAQADFISNLVPEGSSGNERICWKTADASAYGDAAGKVVNWVYWWNINNATAVGGGTGTTSTARIRRENFYSPPTPVILSEGDTGGAFNYTLGAFQFNDAGGDVGISFDITPDPLYMYCYPRFVVTGWTGTNADFALSVNGTEKTNNTHYLAHVNEASDVLYVWYNANMSAGCRSSFVLGTGMCVHSQVETNPFWRGDYGWINFTVWHSDGWGNISTVMLQVNTTKDYENFTLLWNETGYTLTEAADSSGICTIGSWSNTTSGNNLTLYINLSFGLLATDGWCDKKINATTGVGPPISEFTSNAFHLGRIPVNLIQNGGFETGALSPWQRLNSSTGGTVAVTASTKYSGTYSLYFSTPWSTRQYVQQIVHNVSTLDGNVTFALRSSVDATYSSYGRRDCIYLKFMLYRQEVYSIAYRWGRGSMPPTDVVINLTGVANTWYFWERNFTVDIGVAWGTFSFDEVWVLLEQYSNAASGGMSMYVDQFELNGTILGLGYDLDVDRLVYPYESFSYCWINATAIHNVSWANLAWVDISLNTSNPTYNFTLRWSASGYTLSETADANNIVSVVEWENTTSVEGGLGVLISVLVDIDSPAPLGYCDVHLEINATTDSRICGWDDCIWLVEYPFPVQFVEHQYAAGWTPGVNFYNTTNGGDYCWKGNTTPSGAVGWLHFIANFPSNWLNGKVICINYEYSGTSPGCGIRVYDGYYNRSLASDFPFTTQAALPDPFRGSGLLQTVVVYNTSKVKRWANVTLSLSASSEGVVSIFVTDYDQQAGGSVSVWIYDWLICDRFGSALWRAKIGETNGFTWVEGNRGGANSEYGHADATDMSCVKVCYQVETPVWHPDGWINVTAINYFDSITSGPQRGNNPSNENFTSIDFEVNTTGDAETFTLRWNYSTMTVSELYDPDVICTVLYSSSSIWGYYYVNISMHVQISTAAAVGWCDKQTNATNTASAYYVVFTSSAFRYGLVMADDRVQFIEYDYYTGYTPTITFTNQTDPVDADGTFYMNSSSGGYGYAIAIANFNADWLNGKTVCIRWRGPALSTGGAFIRLYDGSYVRSSSVDFPDSLGLNPLTKGAGLLATWRSKSAGFAKEWVNTTANTAAATEENVSVWIDVHDTHAVAYQVYVYDFLVKNSSGGVEWRAMIYESGNGFTWPEGNRGAADREYGYVLASVSIAYGYVFLTGQNETSPWTVGTSGWINVTVNHTRGWAYMDYLEVQVNTTVDAENFTIRWDASASPFDVYVVSDLSGICVIEDWVNITSGDSVDIRVNLTIGAGATVGWCDKSVFASGNGMTDSNFTVNAFLLVGGVSVEAQNETSPWYWYAAGWINVTVSHPSGWANIDRVDIEVNTTGDAETFTLRWTQVGFTLVVFANPNGIVALNDWSNTTSGVNLSISVNATIGVCTTGWTDKELNVTYDAFASYLLDFTVNAFQILSGFSVDYQDETSPWAIGYNGWVNVSVSHMLGISSLAYFDVNLTTFGAQSVVLRWNLTTYNVTEVSDPFAVCDLLDWSNVTDAGGVNISLNLTWGGVVTPGWCSKEITFYADTTLTANAFLLYYAFGTVIIRVMDNQTYVPIGGALVYLWNATWASSGVSPATGYVTFLNVFNGTYNANATVYSHQYNQTTIPVVGFPLHVYTWKLYLEPNNGNWTYVRAVDNRTMVGIPHASVGLWNATLSVIIQANCTGWAGFFVVDGNYNVNVSAPYWYADNSSATATPSNFILLTRPNRAFPADVPSPWTWFFEYGDPWSAYTSGPGNLTMNLTEIIRGWIWKTELVFLSSTTALIKVVYTTPVNSSMVDFQTRAPPLDDVPVNLYGWGADWANYTRTVKGYCDHGSNMTWNEEYPMGGSVWYHLLDGLYPGKLYLFTIYPGIPIGEYAATYYFRTQPASESEYAYSFGNGSSPWLYQNALMDLWGEILNLSAYKPPVYGSGYPWKWDRANWDHYWYGDWCANATGLTNLYDLYGNNSDVYFTVRMAMQAQNTSLWFDWGDGSAQDEPFYVVPAKAHATEPYTGEGVSFGLYNPQLDEYVFRVALGNISGPVPGSYGCGIFAWDGDLDHWSRTTDYLHGGPLYYGDWRCYDTWWNITVKLPKEAWCVNDPEYWNYEYQVYISGPVATNWEANINNTYVGSFALGSYFCDGLFAVFEYLPDLREVTDHYFGIPPNNINASWDFVRISNCTVNMTHLALIGEYNQTVPTPGEPPIDGEGEGSYASLYPTYYSQNIVTRLYSSGFGPPWMNSGWPYWSIPSSYGAIKDCTYVDLFGATRNRMGAREGNTTDPYTCIRTTPWNTTFFWFDLNTTEGQRFRSLAKEPIASWPTRWLVVGITAYGGSVWTSWYIDMVYLNSGSSWITVAYTGYMASMTQGEVWAWAWNGTSHPVVLGGSGYYGQWDTQTFRANTSVAVYESNKTYSFAGWNYRIDIPPEFIGNENRTAWPDKYSLTSETYGPFPWGEGNVTVHQLKAFDQYYWYIGYVGYPTFGTIFWANATGYPGNLSLPGNESYICWQRASAFTQADLSHPGDWGSFEEGYAGKILFFKVANGSVYFAAMTHGSGGGGDSLYSQYYVLGVNDTDSTPLVTDHTYLATERIYIPFGDFSYNGSLHWNYSYFPCHLELNMTLPPDCTNASRVVVPKVAQWYWDNSYGLMGRWVIDIYTEWWEGIDQNVSEADFFPALYAVDVFYYFCGMYQTTDYAGEIVLMANATELNHTNPLEPVLQLAIGNDGTYFLNKVTVWWNETGPYWGISQVLNLKNQKTMRRPTDLWTVWTKGLWKYDMTNLDYAPFPEWTDHTYGKEDTFPGLATATFYGWPNQSGYDHIVWDIIPTNYSVANNVTDPNAYAGSNDDFYEPIGFTRGMTADGVWLLPEWNSYHVDWTNVGVYNDSLFPYYWRAVDFFRLAPSSKTLQHSRTWDAWAGTGGTSVGSEREGVWDVATFFFNMSDPSLVTADTYPVLEWQMRSAAYWDMNGNPHIPVDKVGIVFNVTYPGGVIVFYTHAIISIGYPANPVIYYTVLTKRNSDLDATPQWDDHSYMAHSQEYYSWYTPTGGGDDAKYRYGGAGWTRIVLNWSNAPANNATMPPGWTDAQFRAGEIYNQTAWAGWVELGGSADDPAIWEMSLPMVAVDEFYDYRAWYTSPGFCGWEGYYGTSANLYYPLNFVINGTWANLSQYSAWLGVYDYVLYMADDLSVDAYIFPDKLWWLANATHFQMAYRMLNGDSQDESPVLMAMNASLGDGEGHLRRNSTSWPEIWTLDVVDFGDIYGYKTSWSIYTWDLRHVGLPDHDDTCPMTKFSWANLTFYPTRSGGFNKWFLEDWGDVSMVDGREGHAMRYSTWGTKTVVYFNVSLFPGVSGYTWVAIVYNTPSAVYPNAFAMKVNASGNWVGYYIHGAHNGGHAPFVQADFTQTMTPYLTGHTLTHGAHYGTETFDFEGEEMSFYVNHTDIPHNGRWIWFRVIFVTVRFARISYRTNDWTSPSAFDYYETIPVYFLKEVSYMGTPPPEFLVFVNSTGSTVYGVNISEYPDDIWNFVYVDRGTLPGDTYNVSLLVGSTNKTAYTRVLYVYRHALSWELTCIRWVYGGASKFTLLGKNWRYWSVELWDSGWFRSNVTLGGELQCMLTVTSISTGMLLARVPFSMFNDSRSHELRDVVSGAMPVVVPNPGAIGRDANVTVYAMMQNGTWVSIWGPSGVTLQSVAIYGDVFEDLGSWLGFNPTFTRTLVALLLTCMIAAGFGHVARMGALGHCVMILIGFWMFTLAGWFPVFFAGLATVAVVGTMMLGRGGD